MQGNLYVMQMRKWIYTLCLLTAFHTAVGQDIHFSQADLNPLFVNPAFTGFFEGRARFSAIYRNQWATVSNPYQTLAATAEWGFFRNRYNSSGLNIGAMVSADKAGSLGYGIAQADITLSFFKALSYNNENFISAGVTAGYGQRGFDPANAEMTDPDEVFDQTSQTYYDIGAGLMWSDQFTDDFGLQLGIAAYHLNRPNISYLKLDSTYLEPKFNFYLNFSIRTSSTFTLQPTVILQFQHQYSEYLYGLKAKYNISQRTYFKNNVFAGVFFRQMDAIVITAGLEYDNWIFGAGYDVNISDLKPASHTVGAVEIGLVYLIKEKKRVKKVKSIPCPTFT